MFCREFPHFLLCFQKPLEAGRHFAPKDKMPQDKMPQGHFAPRHFAPNRTKFWKGDILPQLQNSGGHFAPTFFFALFSTRGAQ